jgi:hypothetical protein
MGAPWLKEVGMGIRWSSAQLILALTLILLIAGSPGRGFATIDLREADKASTPEDLQEVGKQLNNPASSIWNITTLGWENLQDSSGAASRQHGPGIPVDASAPRRFRPALQHPLHLQAGAAKFGEETDFAVTGRLGERIENYVHS